MKRVFQKLVRDNIPQIISAKGEVPTTRILDDAEFRSALLAKLEEEVEEVKAAQGKESVREEIADVLEVLRALAALELIAWKDIESVCEDKKEKRGGFSKKIYLESTE